MTRQRALAQLLHRPAGGTPASVVRHVVAVQAQDARSARLTLRARISGLEPAAIDADDALVVSWLLRGTMHLVHADDLPWLHAATAGVGVATSLRRMGQLGIDDGVVDVVRAALPFTRAEAGEVLGLSGQAVPHALARAAALGVCVLDLRGRFRAVSLPSVDRAAALDELARRYAVAHPGATAEDLAAWSGLPKRDLRPLPDPDEHDPGSPVGARLLPPFDPYLLGFKDRGFAVPPELAGAVFPGGGMFRATATADGRVAGTWKAPGGKVALDGGDPAVFAEDVADVERFLRLGLS